MTGSSLAVWQGPLPRSNWERGRDGNPVVAIVDHWMATTFDSALAHFRDPRSRVSAHYLIRGDGLIYQVVDEDDTAYHAGEYGWNQRSIGIEHEAGPTVPPSDALYVASRALHLDIAARYGFPLTVGLTVKPHNSIVATACPGTLDLERIVGGDMTAEQEAKLDRLLAIAETLLAEANANEPLVWSARAQRSLDVETGSPFDERVGPADPRIRA